MSCGLGYTGINPMTGCIGSQTSGGPLPVTSFESCVADGGTNCTKVKACATGGDSLNACLLDAGFSCEGSVLGYCDPNHNPWNVNCADAGETCSDSAEACSLGPCDPATTYSCKGETLIECDPLPSGDGGYGFVNQECADQGTCGVGPDGGPTCIGSGPSCTVSTCSGSMLLFCEGGHEIAYDCSSFGVTCIPGDHNARSFGYGGAFCGLGNACDLDYSDSCKGSVLHYCDLGKVAELDCADAGWKSCEEGDAGGAHCSP